MITACSSRVKATTKVASLLHISTYSLRQSRIQKPIQSIEEIGSLLTHTGRNVVQNKSMKTLTAIREIPLELNLSKLYSLCGFASGCFLLLVPQKYIEAEMHLPFPNIHELNVSDMHDLKLMAIFLACCASYGYIGGKMYQFKTFKLGDSKKLTRRVGNLVNKWPIALFHGGGYVTVVFYGMFGAFTMFETLTSGKPYGSQHPQHDPYKLSQLGYDKPFRECTMLELKHRARYAVEITAHWTYATFLLALPIFLSGSGFVMWRHRKYWQSLHSRLNKQAL